MKITQRQKQLGAPARVPGQYYIASTERGLVLKTWPKKKSGPKTPAQFYKETEFGLAASWAANPDAGQLDSAIVAAEGTTMVPRDFLTANAYGTLWTLVFEDGTEWVRYRDVTINAQLVLDQVTDDTPSIMWRSPVGWVGIQPTTDGDVVVFQNGVVKFASVIPPPTPYDAGAGAPTVPYWANTDMYLIPPSVGGVATTSIARAANQITFVPLIVPYNRTFTSIAFRIPAGGAVVGSSARLGIYLLDPVKGGPGVVALDAGAIATATVGLKAITINQALARGVYFLALWTSAAITVTGLFNNFSLASCGYALANASPAFNNFLIRTTAFGTPFTDQSANTQTTNTATTAIPIIGIR